MELNAENNIVAKPDSKKVKQNSEDDDKTIEEEVRNISAICANYDDNLKAADPDEFTILISHWDRETLNSLLHHYSKCQRLSKILMT